MFLGHALTDEHHQWKRRCIEAGNFGLPRASQSLESGREIWLLTTGRRAQISGLPVALPACLSPRQYQVAFFVCSPTFRVTGQL